MSRTHNLPSSDNSFNRSVNPNETNVQRRKSSMGFIDEIIKMAVMAAVSVIVAGGLCEYVLKPLWHVIKNNQF